MNLSSSPKNARNYPKYVLIHTAAHLSDKSVSVSSIDEWHAERGFRRHSWWIENFNSELRYIGYHYYISKDGAVYHGRHEREVGAHCRDMNMNRRSIGICFEGHGNFEYFTEEQKESSFDLITKIYSRYESMRMGGSTRIIGHRETGAKKECPGTLVDMDEYRAKFLESVYSNAVKISKVEYNPVMTLPVNIPTIGPDRLRK